MEALFHTHVEWQRRLIFLRSEAAGTWMAEWRDQWSSLAFCYGLIGTFYQSQQQTNSNNSNESVQSLFISDPFMQIPHHQPPIKVLILLTEKRPRGLKNRNSFVVMAIWNILLSPDLPTKESFGEEYGYYLLLICKLMIPVMVSESAEYYSKPQTITYSESMLSSEWAFLG